MDPYKSLKLDFSWSSLKTDIIDPATGKALYVLKYHVTKPQLEFLSANDMDRIGTGTVKGVSIDVDCQIRQRNINIKPLKRWETKYTYLSEALAPDPGSPVTLTCIGTLRLTTWDFVVLDEQQEALAKLSCRIWACHNIANLEFAEERALSQAAKEEIMITSITLLYCMLNRANNPLTLAGAAFAKPGPIEQGNKDEVHQHTT